MKKLGNARHCLKFFGLLLVVSVLTLPCSVAWGGMGSGGGGMGGSGGGGGGMSGGGGIIDPPVGAPFQDPPEMQNLSPTPGVVEVNLEARMAQINVNGTTANLMTYNGCFPGPTIRAKKGDMVHVNYTNNLPYDERDQSPRLSKEHHQPAHPRLACVAGSALGLRHV